MKKNNIELIFSLIRFNIIVVVIKGIFKFYKLHCKYKHVKIVFFLSSLSIYLFFIKLYSNHNRIICARNLVFFILLMMDYKLVNNHKIR